MHSLFHMTWKLYFKNKTTVSSLFLSQSQLTSYKSSVHECFMNPVLDNNFCRVKKYPVENNNINKNKSSCVKTQHPFHCILSMGCPAQGRGGVEGGTPVMVLLGVSGYLVLRPDVGTPSSYQTPHPSAASLLAKNKTGIINKKGPGTTSSSFKERTRNQRPNFIPFFGCGRQRFRTKINESKTQFMNSNIHTNIKSNLNQKYYINSPD